MKTKFRTLLNEEYMSSWRSAFEESDDDCSGNCSSDNGDERQHRFNQKNTKIGKISFNVLE